jgi:two-component system, cell cycle sensor histidine kinase and response regulator CckA
MDEASRVRTALTVIEDPLKVLDSIFAHAPLAFLVYDRAGRCVLANEACAALFGSVPPPGYNIFEDENLAAAGLASLVRRAFAGETVHLPPMWYDPRDLEHVAIGPTEGRRVGTEVTAFPILDREGLASHVVFTIRDASAELRYKETNDKLERLRDAGVLGVFEFRTDGDRVVTDANDTYLELLGYTRDDLARGDIASAKMTPPEFLAGDEAAVAAVRTAGKVGHREKEYFRKDGSRLPVLLAAAQLASDPSRGIGFLLDNSERKRAEVERAAREQRFRALLASTNDAILLRDASGRITFATDSIVRVLGITADEIVGQLHSRAPEIVHPDDVVALEAEEARTRLQPGVPIRSEARLRHRDGTYRTLELIRTNLLDDPAVQSIVVNMRDITETRALQQQFLQAQKMEAVGQLAGGIAHDFNNMLSAILGFAGIIASELPPADPLAADVKEIITAAERASTLTRQLLAFSRKQILEPKVVDLTTQLRDLERMLRRLLGEDIELVMSLAPNLECVKVDPAQIEQVVLNLVINARDALESGGRITIETANVVIDQEYTRSHRDVSPGPYVMVSVSDNGRGMEKNVRERIFEPFFTTKGVGHGTGLGLATVFGIVKQSGGHIWLYSEPGQGTTFKVYLPRHDGVPVAPGARAPRPPPLRGSETVLLVEDEAGVRSFAKRALQRAGYVVLEAANGGEALLIAEQHEGPIHLLLTDVVMPRMSGRALAERLVKAKPSLRVVYMSGYTENTIVHHGVLDDGTDFIAKPIALDVLLAKVRVSLDRPSVPTPQGQQ